VPHKHRKNCNQNPRKKKRKDQKKTPAFYIIDGNASCQTRGSEDPKQKQKQVHTRIVEPGKNKPAKKGIVSWDNNKQQHQQPKKRKKDEQTSKQTKTTKQKRREVVLDKHHHDHDHHTISSNSSNNRS
jgi:hypothetical protein